MIKPINAQAGIRLSWAIVALGMVAAACTSNVPTPQSSTSPLAMATENATALLASTPLPASATILPTHTPAVITVAPAFSGVCKTTGYCPLSDCHKDECLFVSPSDAPYVVGLATLRGYYTQIEKTGFNNISEQCDSFVIVDGSRELILSYLSLIEAGNGVNSKNELNQPIISLDFQQVDEQDKQRILSSTKTRLIELLVVSPIAGGRGAPTCYPPVEIVTIK
jgi:hypothetical protein